MRRSRWNASISSKTLRKPSGGSASSTRCKTRLLSPFCVLSCNRSSSLFSGLLCRFRYSPVERFFYKFYGINCRPKLGTKLLDRFFHRRRQVSPPVNRLTHRFFDGSQHFLYCNFTVGSRHSAVASSFST